MSLTDNLSKIQQRLQAACAQAGRDPVSVQLLAVSKGRSSEEIEEIILQCLRKDRDERFASVSELAEALGPFAPSASAHRINAVARALGPSNPAGATPVGQRMAKAMASTKAETPAKKNDSDAADTQEHLPARAISVDVAAPTENARRGMVQNPATGQHAHWTSDAGEVPKKSRKGAILLTSVLAVALIGTAAVALSMKTPPPPSNANRTVSVSSTSATGAISSLALPDLATSAPSVAAPATQETAKLPAASAQAPAASMSAHGKPGKPGPGPASKLPAGGSNNDDLLLDRK